MGDLLHRIFDLVELRSERGLVHIKSFRILLLFRILLVFANWYIDLRSSSWVAIPLPEVGSGGRSDKSLSLYWNSNVLLISLFKFKLINNQTITLNLPPLLLRAARSSSCHFVCEYLRFVLASSSQALGSRSLRSMALYFPVLSAYSAPYFHPSLCFHCQWATAIRWWVSECSFCSAR